MEDWSWYNNTMNVRYEFCNVINKKDQFELVDKFVRQLELDLQEGHAFESEAYSIFPLEMILEYLKNGHKYYLNKKLPEIEQTISYLVKHAEMDNILNAALQHFFSSYKLSLEEHIAFEEKTIFSYITYLLALNSELDKVKLKVLLQGSDSLSDFVLQHTDTEKDLSKVLQILASYKNTFIGFSPYTLLVRQLSVFETELSLHAKLEDEVLVPRSIMLENKILQECFK